MADPVSGETYFPKDLFALSAREVFIDCGAFDGDTIASFLAVTGGQFLAIAAFEPDPENYAKLNRATGKLGASIRGRIAMFPKAVGESDGVVRFNACGTDGSSAGAGESEVESAALDSALHSFAEPTVIKMDIEGAEPSALRGAARTIARHSPILAVCAYHQQDHIWRIPALIHSINPEYRLYLRPHRIEGWDSVCYAVPPERTLS
jgi:FkbM family methyltransferase